MAQETACLLSVVKNISGVTKRFGQLPPHGVQLANNEQFSMIGDLSNAVTLGGFAKRRKLRALKSALAAEDLAVVSLPNPIVYDAEAEASVMLSVDDGDLVISGPCFDSAEA